MIQLKRKRSDSTVDNVRSPYLPSALDSRVTNETLASQLTRSFVSSRTRKRHRDNRPLESEVHLHTLSLLFSAQKNLPQSSDERPERRPDTIAPLAPPQNPRKQSNLHSFWPASAKSLAPTSYDEFHLSNVGPDSYFLITNCEDCDTALEADGEIFERDLESGDYACTICNRHVCHTCSITNLGIDRKCLVCFGKKIS
ncbi:hypothetical protein K3495_g13172 [Podosphaera aphanis]|nr:hypothetical protein K3495_g13172 [Podosphaera aphanis]